MKMSSLCYMEREGQYLMLHRTKKVNDANQDKWLGIGGQFEADESPEACMLREVREETGLVPFQWQYRGIVTFVSDRCETEYMHLFTAQGFEGEPGECDEGELEWIEKDALLSLPMWAGDRIFLELIAQPGPFFSLKLVYAGEKLEAAWLNGRPLSLPAT